MLIFNQKDEDGDVLMVFAEAFSVKFSNRYDHSVTLDQGDVADLIVKLEDWYDDNERAAQTLATGHREHSDGIIEICTAYGVEWCMISVAYDGGCYIGRSGLKLLADNLRTWLDTRDNTTPEQPVAGPRSWNHAIEEARRILDQAKVKYDLTIKPPVWQPGDVVRLLISTGGPEALALRHDVGWAIGAKGGGNLSDEVMDDWFLQGSVVPLLMDNGAKFDREGYRS